MSRVVSTEAQLSTVLAGTGCEASQNIAELDENPGNEAIQQCENIADTDENPDNPLSGTMHDDGAALLGRADLVFKGAYVAHWQQKLSKVHDLQFRYTQLINCALHCTAMEASEFDAPVPTSLADWTDEPILSQHSLLSLLNADRLAALSALRHARTVCSCSKSSVTVVVSHAQLYRARTLSLTDGMVEIAHVDRGVPLFRAADEKLRRAGTVVHVLHLAHKGVQRC